MLRAAILDDSPVVFMFHKALQGMGWLGTMPGSITEVPQSNYVLPLDKVAVPRAGRDVTLVGLGITVHHALDAAAVLEKDGISCEVVDLRSIAPLDREGIRASVRKTGRLIAIDDDYLSYGVAGEVIASVLRGCVGTSQGCRHDESVTRTFLSHSAPYWKPKRCPTVTR